MFSSFLWQPLLGHNWYNDSHTYSHRKLFLYAKRYVFSYVDLFSHYTGSSFQPVTLKLECSFIVVQLFCIWYTLTYHMFSTTSCRFLSKSRMTSSLKLKHVLYHSTSPCSLLYASLHITLFTHLCITPLTWSLLSSGLLPHINTLGHHYPWRHS